MRNAHPSQFAPRGTAPPSTIPDQAAAAHSDADAVQRAIKRVQDHNAKLRLAPEEFAERFRSRIMNSGSELTVEQVFAKLDADVGALLQSRHQELIAAVDGAKQRPRRCCARSCHAVQMVL